MKARDILPPVVLGTGLAVLVASIVSVTHHGVAHTGYAGTIEDLLTNAADVANIDENFIPFGLAVAYRESRFNPNALNTDSVQNSCELYDASGGIFDANPYGRAAFCIGAGGLYGFFPATGLKPKTFRNLDPKLIFDPIASTAMFADYVERIVTGYFDKLPSSSRNWLAIRRSMAGLATMFDTAETTQRSRDVRVRLAEDLAAIGADPDMMYDRPKLGPYPGAAVVWSALRAV
jgi:hypothetical protein